MIHQRRQLYIIKCILLLLICVPCFAEDENEPLYKADYYGSASDIDAENNRFERLRSLIVPQANERINSLLSSEGAPSNRDDTLRYGYSQTTSISVTDNSTTEQASIGVGGEIGGGGREETGGGGGGGTTPTPPLHNRVYSHYKYDRPYNRFLNYGRKKVKQGIGLENEIIRSKVDVLGSILKLHVQKLRQVREKNQYSH